MQVEAQRVSSVSRPRRRVHQATVTSRGRILTGNSYLAAKRLLDIALSLAALIALAPVFALVAILIKFDSKGPVIYRRRVVAQNGHSPHPITPETVETFDAYKFRSMWPDADDYLDNHPVLLAEYLKDFKLDDDPRITRVGRFLRKTNLDELPQFINVLMGQMSLVGPRIVTPPELEKYGALARRLLMVRPGMSGFWQAKRGGDHSYERRVKMDMAYIRKRGMGLDMRIILDTVKLMIGVRGSG